MLYRFCLAFLACALMLVFGVQTTQAGWRDTELTRAHDASSLVISIKKHKHDDGDDNGDNHKKHKHAATGTDDGLEQKGNIPPKCVGVDCGPAEINTPPKCVGVDCGPAEKSR